MKFLRAAVALIASAAVFAGSATARDDGRYANSPLKPWFDSLRSGKGLCCSDADGSVVSDVDWESKDGHYRVRLEGQWIDVPDDAVITVPNRAGRTMVWPVKGRVRDFDPLLPARQHDVATARPVFGIAELGRRQMDLQAGRADTRRNHTSLDSVGTSR